MPFTSLFRSAGLAVRAYGGRGSRLCFVVFDPMEDDLSLDRKAFGESFFASHGVDAVHVLSSRNLWYQDPDLATALDAVRTFVAPYARVVTYGSSMGGYAALRFSARVGAHCAVAISPQYSMQGRFAKVERRWLASRKAATWLYERPGEPLPPVAEAVVFYDDRGMDRPHVEAIRCDLPHAVAVPIPFAGHPAGGVLMETGVISATILAAANGTLDVRALVATLRRERHRSGQYLFTLARRQPRWRLRTKAALAARAVAAHPSEQVYLSYAGLAHEAAGLRAEALAWHERAVQDSTYGWAYIRRATALFRAGRIAEACRAAEAGAARLPRDALSPETLALALLRERPTEALTMLRRAGHVLRRNWPARLLRLATATAGMTRLVDGEPARRLTLALIRPVLHHPGTLAHELADADWG